MQQQAYQAYANTPKGTLVPGQTISVNKYTVQVERYLSQGGFSHVYLVRTPTPVYNTTHHVLKRIAVANEAMLTEVRKEVDIMRILKGHPNIVYLIDAAWHRMANGMYEVFILMEFCPGGGIIDMMNRRLRERLTEAEILQIFVDVCEGVAAMHNLRPALLHRDLKVENILQSSNTSFKLCDFGSATPVAPRPPSTTQEIRALEADLNRHTTLQYRAPEMVDSYLRRPVDEKSDVWALGVLLYKLCYYTTPFEEHGPLAILNVQYRIPPYPVYSSQLNALIASMLREHGTQRPSAFELLAQVHRMRGTKSRFTYNIPPPQPLSPRAIQAPTTNPLDNLVSYRPPSSGAAQSVPALQPKPSGTGIQARDKVLEAIAPMRRGRPSTSQQNDVPSSVSRPPSPPKTQAQMQGKTTTPQNWLEDSFGAEEDKAWKAMKSSAPNGAVRAHKSGAAAASTWKPRDVAPGLDDAWSVETRISKATPTDQHSPTAAFGDNFAEKLWNAYDTNVDTSLPSAPAKIAPKEGSRNTRLTITKGKDAFEGLGLSPSDVPPPPTLGEARKLRTGLAAVNGNSRSVITPSPSISATRPAPSPAPRPTPSPHPAQPTPSSSWRSTPSIQPSSNNPSSLPQLADLTAETRFPSLEELDATFGTSSTTFIPPIHSTSQPELRDRLRGKVPESTSLAPPPLSRPTPQRAADGLMYGQSGVRSQQVTGIAMRENREDKRGRLAGLENAPGSSPPKRASYRPVSRPSLSRKHRSSISIKPTPQPQASEDIPVSTSGDIPAENSAPRRREPKDWLTGDIDTLASPIKDTGRPETPVLREFTNKRSSFIEENTVHIQSPQEAIAAQPSPPHKLQRAETPPSPSKKPTRTARSRERKPIVIAAPAQKAMDRDFISTGRPHGESPIDSWDPPTASAQAEKIVSSSEDEESPEDAARFAPPKVFEKIESSPRRKRTKGRQSSVHDLVDLWGGGVVQTKERPKDSPTVPDFGDHDRRRQAGAKLHKSRSVAVPSAARHHPDSPQHVPFQPSNSPTAPAPRRSPSRSPKRPTPSPHFKQTSAGNPTTLPTSSSSRTRPQSMLVFPMSKSTSEGKIESSAGLSVPLENPRKHGSRRTSITDMVQRYEAIGGGAKGAGPGPPPVLPKPVALKVATHSTSSGSGGRFAGLPPQGPSSPAVSRFHGSRVGGAPASPIPDDKVSGGDPAKSRLPATGLPKSTFTGDGGGGRIGEAANQPSLTGLPSGSSSKMMNPAPRERTTTLDGLPSSSSLFPSHKTPGPSDEQPRSPSPDKPYQGVGKLIDQWQRKTTESDPPRRGGYVTKRAGLVSGSTGPG
ncbi:hypothetical protein BV22DRAFT_1047856 [Leucogyrophana mollusca]|uniref:Uncharacterized protein n=1 Tax=Leucogyrophana mollusca TaxID=85980 RepID=A0ACB8BDJ9_9AGAM|nr:hypothetical protein BV22DRAFT_1047856 [Leucogyrophana mollusca]